MLPSLMRTRADARYTQQNKNAGLTKVAKPASVKTETTRLKLATSGVIDLHSMDTSIQLT
jgi:type II secretory pathway component PulC